MKLVKILSVLTVIGSFAVTAKAQAPFQASLWAPEPQLVPANEDVTGIRLQIYGENRNVKAWDLGFGHSTTNDFVGFSGPFSLYNHVGGTTTGVQWGALNYTEGAVTGWQGGLLNITEAKVTGLQVGFINWNNIDAADFSGVQLGLVNTAKHAYGLQFGFINYAQTLKGVQLGLWNQVDSRDWGQFDPLPKVFPFINIGF